MIISPCSTQFFQILFCPVIGVRRMFPSNPQSYGDWSCSERITLILGFLCFAVLADEFAGTDKGRCSRKLLSRKKPERIAHDNGCSSALCGMTETTVKNGHCGKTQIGFRFSTAGREPDQIHQGTVGAVIIGHRGDIQKHERKLERSPFISIFWKSFIRRSVINVIQNFRQFLFIRV